jgi:predicted RNase H-like nuclease (RuvC/YqgF family)
MKNKKPSNQASIPTKNESNKGDSKGERIHSGHKKYIKALEEYIYKLEKENKTFLEAIEKCQEEIEKHQNHVNESLTFIKPTIEAFEKQRGKLKELGYNSVEELETGLIDLDNFLTPLLRISNRDLNTTASIILSRQVQYRKMILKSGQNSTGI